MGVPESTIEEIICFVGSPSFGITEPGARRGFATKNPAWSGAQPIKVICSDTDLVGSSGMAPEQECVLGCLKALGDAKKHRTTAIQSMMVKVPDGRRIPICLATVIDTGGETKVLLLEDEPIPFEA
jgi:hypothetical protein